MDALEFIGFADREVSRNALFCIDPPYYNKGSSLYTSFYRSSDHASLSSAIMELDRPWLVTYDDTPEIRRLYSSRDQYSFDVNYSVQVKRMATELLVTSADLVLPVEISPRKVA